MNSKIKTTEIFYHNLGKLFYAIAFVDKQVREEEIQTLRDYVSSYWMDYDELTDVFGSDAAHLIKVVFEGVQFFNETSEDMYEDFIAYKNEQPHLFTREVNELILATSKAIAHSFSGVNKSELIIINKLELELNRL